MELIAGKISEKFIELIVTSLVSKIISSTINPTSGSATGIIYQFTEKTICTNYSINYAAKTLKIRTLHSAESDIFLDEIYTPLDVEDFDKKKIMTINDRYSLKEYKFVNIVGIAGQGKSTILRKIFLEEMKRGEYFPLFIELRRISDKSSITDHLIRELKEIGILCDKENIEEFLKSGRALLLLDGFDEIHSKKRMEILKDITNIETKFNTKIISTSRPDTEICIEPGRENLFVRELDIGNILKILKKLDKENKNKELKNIIKNNNTLQKVLKTPILVNLFYVCYPYLDTVPSHATDFYERIFMTLYSRHDKIKNFCREKYSNIISTKALDVFNAFSYFSLINDHIEFSEQSLIKIFKLAFEFEGIAEDEIENIKNDIINITCLIQPDGFDRYIYLHKSIQEFHAARFIANLEAGIKKEIYEMIGENIIKDQSLDNLITFLHAIDKKDFYSMLTNPLAEKHKIKEITTNRSQEFIKKLTFDSIAGRKVRIEFNKKDNSYNASFVSHISPGTILSVIFLLMDGRRIIINKIERFIVETTFDLLTKGQKYTPNQINFLQNKKIKNAPHTTHGEEVSEYDLREYLITFGMYDNLEDVIKEIIEEFHTKHLKTLERDRNNMKSSLAKYGLKK